MPTEPRRTAVEVVKDEPVAAVFGTASAVVAVIVLLRSFAVPITADQQLAIVGVWTTVVMPFAIAWTRRRVTTRIPEDQP